MNEQWVPPPPRTRPRNRRDLIVGAAAELFGDKGYARVSMGDVAGAVNVRPSALYRYFASKQDLLLEVVSRGTQLRLEAIRGGAAAGLDVVLANLADGALESRSSTRLWAVEARNADSKAQEALRQDVRALPEEMARVIGRERREVSAAHAHLLAWAALDVVASISFHDHQLPGRALRAELVAMMSRITGVEAGPPAPAPPSVLARKHPARRERVIASAATMFAARGYSAVRLEDIAANASMSAAGLYTYVESKTQLLEIVARRAADALGHAHAVLVGDPASRTIDLVVESYVRFAWTSPDLLTVLLVDVRELDSRVGAAIGQVLDDVDVVWTSALCEAIPGLDPVVARVRSRAAQMIALDILSTARLRRMSDATAIVSSSMVAALGVTQAPGAAEPD